MVPVSQPPPLSPIPSREPMLTTDCLFSLINNLKTIKSNNRSVSRKFKNYLVNIANSNMLICETLILSLLIKNQTYLKL